jgi:hypothetical protein
MVCTSQALRRQKVDIRRRLALFYLVAAGNRPTGGSKPQLGQHAFGVGTRAGGGHTPAHRAPGQLLMQLGQARHRRQSSLPDRLPAARLGRSQLSRRERHRVAFAYDLGAFTGAPPDHTLVSRVVEMVAEIR